MKEMLAESMRLSPRWAAEYRGFWDLPEDFDFDVVTPTVRTSHARSPGKLDPDEAADAFLRRVRPARWHEGVPAATGGRLDERDAGGAARREAHPPRGQGHPVRLQGCRPVREVARGAAGARLLRRPDRAARRRGAEHRPPSRRTAAWSHPLRLRPRLLRAQPQLEDGRARPRPRDRGGDARGLPEDGADRIRDCSRCASTTARPARASSRSRRFRRATRRARVPARHRGLLPRLARRARSPEGASARRADDPDHGIHRRAGRGHRREVRPPWADVLVHGRSEQKLERALAKMGADRGVRVRGCSRT